MGRVLGTCVVTTDQVEKMKPGGGGCLPPTGGGFLPHDNQLPDLMPVGAFSKKDIKNAHEVSKEARMKKFKAHSSRTGHVVVQKTATRQRSPSFDRIPAKLSLQNYSKKEPRQDGGGYKPSTFQRQLSTFLEPHCAPHDYHPPPIPTLSTPKKDGTTLPAITPAIQAHLSRISPPREKRSETPEPIIIYPKTLEELILEYFFNLSTKKKIVFCFFIFSLILFCDFLLIWFGKQLSIYKDKFSASLTNMMDAHEQKLSNVTKKLDDLEKAAMALNEAEIPEKINNLVYKVDTEGDGNSLKVAVMDRLVRELEGIGYALSGLHQEVEETLNCGWTPEQKHASQNQN